MRLLSSLNKDNWNQVLNSAFVLVLTTVTSISAICKTAVVAQDGSVLILPFLINHMALISASTTENNFTNTSAYYITFSYYDCDRFSCTWFKWFQRQTSVFQILQFDVGKILPHCRCANTQTNLYLASLTITEHMVTDFRL